MKLSGAAHQSFHGSWNAPIVERGRRVVKHGVRRKLANFAGKLLIWQCLARCAALFVDLKMVSFVVRW
jgi:hypothetical protein